MNIDAFGDMFGTDKVYLNIYYDDGSTTFSAEITREQAKQLRKDLKKALKNAH